MNAVDERTDSSEQDEVIRQANSLWRRAGVRGADRNMLRSELETELDGARYDGRAMTSILGDDSAAMLRSWAQERGMCGRALRFGLTVPAAFVGIVAGLALVLLALIAGFTGRSTTFDPGRLVLPFYASAGVLAYLCALLCVWGVLRRCGDPHAASTAGWLAALLPVGAALSGGAGVAAAWWRNFNTSSTVFVVVVGVVVVGLGLTVGLSRYLAVRRASSNEPGLV